MYRMLHYNVRIGERGTDVHLWKLYLHLKNNLCLLTDLRSCGWSEIYPTLQKSVTHYLF